MTTNVSNRGLRILDALLKDLLKKGMSQATDIILTGCSGSVIKINARIFTGPPTL